MERILSRVTRVSGVRMAALCSYDGIHILSEIRAGTEGADEVAAMSAEIGRAASTLLATACEDALRTATFEASTGRLVLSDMGRGYLAAVADPGASAGLLWLEVERAADDLRAAFGAGEADERVD